MIFVTFLVPLVLAVSMLASPAQPAQTLENTETVELTNESFTFRNVEWGLSMTELIDVVVDQEYQNGLTKDGYNVSTDRFDIYDSTVGGYKCQISYFLVDGQFADGAYFLRENHSNNQLYYSDYTDLVAKYTKKYGKPITDKKEWIGGSIYKDEPENYGMAIAIGDLQMTTVWEAKDGSRIEFFMTGDNFDISTRIDYLCPGYYDMNQSSDDEGI